MHQFGDRTRLRVGKSVLRGAAIRPSVTGAVDKQHFGAAFKPFAERFSLIPEVAAGAVEKDDGRKVGVFRRGDMQSMQPVSADIDEFADGGIEPFDPSALYPGKKEQPRENCRNRKQD